MHILLSIALLSLAGHPAPHETSLPDALPPQTTLPIRFTKTVDAAHAHTGDRVYARTIQKVVLPGGQSLPAGTPVTGHVLEVRPFVRDAAPYAIQAESTLVIRFDTVGSPASALPLRVYIRALADPLASAAARTPESSDLDSLATVTQVGGDRLTPSQKEVLSPQGDVVEYNRRDGVYAHLIAASGNSPEGCDASRTEVSMGIFSASACGLYGFADLTLQETGKAGASSTLMLGSRRRSPTIWKNSTALLEVLPPQSTPSERQENGAE